MVACGHVETQDFAFLLRAMSLQDYRLKSVHMVHMVHMVHRVHRPQKRNYQFTIINLGRACGARERLPTN